VIADTYRFRVGNFSCLAIQDANVRYPLGMFLMNLPRDRYEQRLRERGENPDEIDLPYTSWLVDTERERVLVDTGVGPDGPVPGQLLHQLRAEGISPDDINVVVLTHAHPDHIGGNVTEDGTLAFPKARYVMFKNEWEYWMSGPDLNELPLDQAFKDTMRAFARKHLPPIQGRLDLFEREAEIVAGITAVAAFGHSPGQMALEIQSAGDRLLFVADAIVHPLHVEYPEARGATDHLPKQVVTTRRRLLEKAVLFNGLIATSHFRFPGIGHVVSKGGGWEWQPIVAGV
jgi:glyoxylase-like metal-dependent hydrolase (beta-lactamase superfamily II)